MRLRGQIEKEGKQGGPVGGCGNRGMHASWLPSSWRRHAHDGQRKPAAHLACRLGGQCPPEPCRSSLHNWRGRKKTRTLEPEPPCPAPASAVRACSARGWPHGHAATHHDNRAGSLQPPASPLPCCCCSPAAAGCAPCCRSASAPAFSGAGAGLDLRPCKAKQGRVGWGSGEGSCSCSLQLSTHCQANDGADGQPAGRAGAAQQAQRCNSSRNSAVTAAVTALQQLRVTKLHLLELGQASQRLLLAAAAQPLALLVLLRGGTGRVGKRECSAAQNSMQLAAACTANRSATPQCSERPPAHTALPKLSA